MPDTLLTDEVEGRLVSSAHRRDAVRAVLLTSTRAIAGAEVDAFSDYDAVLVVRNVGSFAADPEGLLRTTAADELLRRHRVVLVGDAPGAVHLA